MRSAIPRDAGGAAGLVAVPLVSVPFRRVVRQRHRVERRREGHVVVAVCDGPPRSKRAAASGPPPHSTSRWRFVPGLPRSVGLGRRAAWQSNRPVSVAVIAGIERESLELESKHRASHRPSLCCRVDSPHYSPDRKHDTSTMALALPVQSRGNVAGHHRSVGLPHGSGLGTAAVSAPRPHREGCRPGARRAVWLAVLALAARCEGGHHLLVPLQRREEGQQPHERHGDRGGGGGHRQRRQYLGDK